MTDKIQSLKQAVEFSPDNVQLRNILATEYKNSMQYTEAAEEYKECIALDPQDTSYKVAYAECSYYLNNYSTCIVVLEDVDDDLIPVNVKVLLAKSYIAEKSYGQAKDIYQEIIAEFPEFKDEELDAEFRMGVEVEDDDQEQEESNELYTLLEKPDVNFDHVGGLDQVKKEINLKIILPMQNQELFKAYGKKAGGGILLYGPPGCGKTLIAKATAGQINANFINVGINDVLDMWIGNSEKKLNDIFTFARQNKPCVIFFDEIDALGASRSDMKHSSGRHLINQFLLELDGVESDNEDILILGATNTPWNLDTAFRRPGRFDRIIFVPPPDDAAREKIINIQLENKPHNVTDMESVCKKMKDFSGADINAVIDIATEGKLEQALETGNIEPITGKDLVKAAKRHHPSTKEWFSTAKNYALFSNESGIYDDILKYLGVKK